MYIRNSCRLSPYSQAAAVAGREAAGVSRASPDCSVRPVSNEAVHLDTGFRGNLSVEVDGLMVSVVNLHEMLYDRV